MYGFLCPDGLFPENITSNTTIGEIFTPCLTFTFIPSFPTLFALTALLSIIFSAQFHRSQALTLWSSTTRLKLIIGIISILCSISNSFITSLFSHYDQNEKRIFEILDATFCLFSLSTHRLSLKFGYNSSGLLHIGWLLRLISLIPINFYQFYDVITFPNFLNIILALFVLIEFICALIQIVILCSPDSDKTAREYERLDEKPPCPFDTSSAFQEALQTYAGTLLRKSFKQRVSCDDFWQLDQSDQAANIRKQTSKFTGTNNSLWSLCCLIIRLSWRHHAKAYFHSIITIICRYLYYLFLSAVLEFSAGNYPHWLAIFPAIGLVLTDLVKNTALMQLYLHGNLAFYNTRTALTTLIFDKMLKLSPSAQTSTSTGVILNYITVDVIHSRQFWTQLCDWIYCPAVMFLSLTILVFQVGFRNMAYGLIVLVVCQAISLFLTKIDARFTDSQMKHKDDRLKLINDLLNGIRVLKLYGWEASMQKMVSKIRRLEVREIFKAEILSAIIEMSFETSPFLATLTTFYGYVIIDGQHLTPKSAFVILLLFDLIRYSTYKMPKLLTHLVTTLISLKRVLKFLNEKEREERSILPPTKDDEFVVDISKASFSWTSSFDSIILSDINLNIRAGQLVAIMGPVASGKSTLLSAISNELPPICGDLTIRSSTMAYFEQQPWIQNMTVKDNILFESDYNTDLYERTLDACALRDDLQLLPGGDLTEIGERGINLSGGQKARVSLARAVYQQSDFYILDDPLSAVDSHVGRQIFTNVIANGGLLDGKTRIIAVNSTTFLDQFDLIVCLKGGKITYCGPYSGLKNQSTASLASQASSQSATKLDNNNQIEEKKEEVKISKNIADEEFEHDSLIEAESLREGRVSLGMYTFFIKEFGIAIFLCFLFSLFAGACTTRAFSNLYMANWSTHAFNMTKEESMHSLIVYGVLGLTSDLFFVFAFLLVAVGCYRASTAFHKKLINSILRAPMSFFDKTPLGRIMNRFSMDTENLDTSVCQDYGYLFLILGEAVRQFMGIFYAIPLLIPAVLPLIITCVFVSRYFNAASAQFRRIASNSMSIVCSSVQDAYMGASSIRVFNAIGRFRTQFNKKLDQTAESNSVEIIANCWVQIRMDMFTNFTILLFLLISIWFSNNGLITLGILGMIVNSSVAIGGLFGELSQSYRDAETEIVCIERLKEYILLENELIWKHPCKAHPADYSVEFDGISLRYREQDEPVIHKVTFKVESGQRVGIVGRTGAGKTSLTSLLFRLIEPFEGCIRIGGVDIKDLGPKLRSTLTIIPQDPVLFCGNLRSNLDPFEEFNDEQLRDALKKAHLSEFIESLVDGLDYEIADGGNNLSVGQRQLVCLARALLRSASILVLDEATASVDPETDQLIQQTLRENFGHCTVLTIAHRLNTVMDYDKILVMKMGQVAEYDSPTNLLTNQNSLFYEFAKMALLI